MKVQVCIILKKKKRTCVFKNVVKENEQWFCIYVEDDLDLSIMFVIHWALSFCGFIFLLLFVFFFLLLCSLCCRGVRKWCSQAWSYLQCFFKQKFKHIKEDMTCIVCYPKGGCNVKNVHWLFFMYAFCGCTMPKPSIHDKEILQLCPNLNHLVNVPFDIVMCITINHL
jgi:hypothetical protein